MTADMTSVISSLVYSSAT